MLYIVLHVILLIILFITYIFSEYTAFETLSNVKLFTVYITRNI